MDRHLHHPPADRVARRALALGAAWSVPALAVATPAPAVAASACASECPSAATWAFGTSAANQNGWTFTQNGTFYGGTLNAVEYYPSGFSFGHGTTNLGCYPTAQAAFTPTVSLTGPGYVVRSDPNIATTNVTLNRDFCMKAGTTYTFCWNWITKESNTIAQFVQAYVTPLGNPLDTTGIPIGPQLTTGALGGTSAALLGTGSGSQCAAFTPTMTGDYTFYWRFHFATASSYPAVKGCDQTSNDFAIGQPTITCT